MGSGTPTGGKLPDQHPVQNRNDKVKNTRFWAILVGVIVLVVGMTWLRETTSSKEVKFGDFLRQIESGELNSSNVFELQFTSKYIQYQDRPQDGETTSTASSGTPASEEPKPDEIGKKSPDFVIASLREGKSPQRFRVPIGFIPESKVASVVDLLNEKKISFASSKAPPDWGAAFSLALMAAIVIIFILFLRRMSGPGQAMSFGRSRAKLMAEDDVKVTFEDVAGINEAVEELREVVEFLRTPGKYQALGGRIPRGVLLVGPPGTGKTLLAKAVAGEAGVPFFSLSGSDFVEMFVGVGAARVRDMFSQAAAKSPSIIFIDELDALGKARGSGMPGGHDEREQTLNALLVEMDGFSSDQSVIVMGATNRPETLDPALMRPGRFDRHVLVDRPDYKGREATLNVHSKKIKMAEDVNLGRLAKLTPGFVGADLENLVNEAALLAARKDKNSVSMHDFEEAIERVIAGLEKSSKIIQEDERQRVAYHESGHALVASCLPMTDPVHKISIIPRGFGALGYMLQRPEDDRHLITQTEIVNRICVMLGGIAAEDIVFEETSTGAQNDLERATDLASRMVMEFGMSPKLGRVNYRESKRSPFLNGATSGGGESNHSEHTLREIDLEIRRIIDECMETSREILRSRRAVLEQVTKELMELEVMNGDQLKVILDAHRTGPQLKPGTAAAKLPLASEDVNFAANPSTNLQAGS
ncbi:ATP-dependent zinc metalloprotease FtsH [Planctomicrobium sp. SH668]|uniref:ATP-dependent zinc metalloprotease FtsH n=1 Tax=Planctomicrobium sp. SH668 TaxID=3448126 RepID=UPI003F5C2769